MNFANRSLQSFQLQGSRGLLNYNTFIPKSFKNWTAAQMPMLEKNPKATATKVKSANPFTRDLMSLKYSNGITPCP